MTRAPLVDRFGRTHTYLRISITDRCNFRCGYCMPPEGLDWRSRDEILTFEEIIRLASLFVEMGITKIRLTGGEPTVRRGIEELISRLASLPGITSLLMTTNGTILSSKAASYRRAGLTGLNISLDSLRRNRFKEITLRDELPRVLEGIQVALGCGYESIKLNVVVMAGVNEDELLDFVEFTREHAINVRFIEFMPFEGNGWRQASVFPYRLMREVIESKYELTQLDTDKSAVGKDFAVTGHEGTLGFVTSMTESFCSDCNRVRLTAEGAFKACLFAGAETNLRDRMRQGADETVIEALIREGLSHKWRAHPPMDLLAQVPNRSMVAIGG